MSSWFNDFFNFDEIVIVNDFILLSLFKQSHTLKLKNEHRVAQFCNSTDFILLILGRCEMPFCDQSFRSQLFLCSGSSAENVTLSDFDILHCARTVPLRDVTFNYRDLLLAGSSEGHIPILHYQRLMILKKKKKNPTPFGTKNSVALL